MYDAPRCVVAQKNNILLANLLKCFAKILILKSRSCCSATG